VEDRQVKLSKELAKYYHTAAEARKELGLDEEAFQYWVRKGRIKKIVLPGRSQGVYSKKEVATLRNQITTTLIAEQDDGVKFRKATEDDIEQEAELAHLIFGERARAIEERTAFLKKNPDIDFHLYDQDRLVAYINIVPLKHTAIEQFMQGGLMAWKIGLDNIEQYMAGKPVECLIIDMVTTPTVPPNKRTFYGSRLLSGLLEVLAEAGARGIEITKVYAASDTPTGIRILKNAGFQIIGETRKGRLSFMLDVANSDEKVLKEYKEVLEEWKKRASK
jgi:N-acetylglutamate synthase-like GNAT family acetyltransferase